MSTAWVPPPAWVPRRPGMQRNPVFQPPQRSAPWRTPGRPMPPPGWQPQTPTAQQDPEGFGDALALLTSTLGAYGLESLVPWAMSMLREDRSVAEITLMMRDTAEFQARFPAIAEIDRLNADLVAAGETPVTPINSGEYVQFEQQTSQIAQQAGLPSWFFGANGMLSQDVVTGLLVGQVSVPEFAERIESGFSRINQAPAEVRAAFSEMFGVEGDRQLAGWFLSDEQSLPEIERAVGTAQVAGAGRVFGFGLDAGEAGRLAGLGFGWEQALGAFGQAARLQPLARELSGEADTLDEDDLWAAAFGVDADAAERLRRRGEARVAEFSGGGGAMLGSGGVQGAGSARR